MFNTNGNFYKDEDLSFDFTVEGTDKLVFMHWQVSRPFNKGKLVKCRRLFFDFSKRMLKEGKTVAFALTPSPKFAKLVGGRCDYIDTFGDKQLLAWPLDGDYQT